MEKFEEIGKRIDAEVERLRRYIDEEIAPETERRTASFLRDVSGKLDEFSDKERDRILAGLYSLLEIGEVRVTRAMAGSIRLHLELKPEDADKIYAATKKRIRALPILS